MNDPENVGGVMPQIQAMFRPVLTGLLAVGLFAASLFLVYLTRLAADLWFSSWMQIIGMMVAFFFGERSALKTHDDEKRS